MVIIIILIATIDIAMFYLLSKTAKIFNLIELISRTFENFTFIIIQSYEIIFFYS